MKIETNLGNAGSTNRATARRGASSSLAAELVGLSVVAARATAEPGAHRFVSSTPSVLGARSSFQRQPALPGRSTLEFLKLICTPGCSSAWSCSQGGEAARAPRHLRGASPFPSLPPWLRHQPAPIPVAGYSRVTPAATLLRRSAHAKGRPGKPVPPSLEAHGFERYQP
jgi:hypothetical protein